MGDLKVGDQVFVKGSITEIHEDGSYSVELAILAPFGVTHELSRNTSMIPASEVVSQTVRTSTGKRSK